MIKANIWTDLAAAIHVGNRQLVLAVAGGGSKAISQLLEVPGASRSVLEATVPYSAAALEQWLGGAPDQSCGEPTARAMAMAAWMRARRLAPEADPHQLVGASATASLASDRPKRGDHRIHVALQTATTTTSHSLVFVKGQRDRKKEEWLAAKLLLLMLGRACGVDSRDAADAIQSQLLETEVIESRHQQAEPDWTELLLGDRDFVVLPATSKPAASKDDTPKVVFPGAFNPPHEGHRQMRQIAAARTGAPVAYELSIRNVDKPPIDFIEIADRLAQLRQFDAQTTLLLTAAPTFRAKSALFPGCVFVVGADTMQRIADPHYYDGDQAGYNAAVAQIAERGCRFLVFGRQVDRRFQTLGDLQIPTKLKELCDEVAVDEFREDVSSTQVRQMRR